MKKSKVLVVGGTGYIGRRIAKASLSQGYPTHVLRRPEIGMDVEKIHLLLSFKAQGAHLVEASFSNHESLVNAIKQVDVVICAMSGAHSSGAPDLLLQLKLVKAIKEAGNIKRFLQSEFGMDPARMSHALEPGNMVFDEKMVVRKAIEDAKIPYTYVSANCYATFFAGNLSQFETGFPPRDRVTIYGDGNTKVLYLDEDDVAAYTIKTIGDPRTLNKTLYLRPPENVLSQMQLVEKWEKLIGKTLEKSNISVKALLELMKGQKGLGYIEQSAICHLYHIYYEGCLTNFDIGDEAEEASMLYPEIQYIRMDEVLARYL